MAWRVTCVLGCPHEGLELPGSAAIGEDWAGSAHARHTRAAGRAAPALTVAKSMLGRLTTPVAQQSSATTLPIKNCGAEAMQ
jgi:hypothetical protein